MQHWLYPSPMQPADDGWCEQTFRLRPGTYQYKFQSEGQWALDPANARTRSVDGARNSVLVIDGADEPVLHVPARPYVFEEDDGRLCVRAALRRTAGDRLELRWDEGAGPRRVAMREVAREDEHRLFEAHVAGASKQLEYVFALGDGTLVGAAGGAGQALRVTRAAVRPGAPTWWRDAVVYSIFVDRFRASGGWRDPSIVDRAQRAGGDLRGVIEALPHLVDLGVTVLHLTPICVSPSVHRYDAIDPRAVAPELGGEAALGELLDAAHAAGLRVMLDVAITHVHRDFAPFRDVRERGRESPYAGWFTIENFPFFEGFDPGYAHYQKGQWQEPLLRTSDPEVVEHLCDTFVAWAKRGADGFRIDAAADVQRDVVEQIAKAVRSARRDAALFAEYIPDNIEHWTEAAADAATDFVAQQALYDWLWRRTAGAARVAEVCARRRFTRGGPGWTAIGFTATHDQPRLLTLVRDPRIARLAQLFTIMRPTIPAIYYGDEIGLAADEAAAARGFEDSWPDRQCMPWDAAHWDHETLALVRDAIRVRRSQRALARGDETFLATGTDDVLAFRRSHAGDAIDVVLNGSAHEHCLPLPGTAAAEVLLSVHGAALDGTALVLPPYAGIVLRRTRAVTEDALDDATAIAHNRLLGAMAFREGSTETPAYPANLYVTVTEACNLRCQHCITHAPEITRSGRARELRPWLLEALREAFAAADYFAFAHGGESLVAPGFFDVLAAIARARAGRPTDVHLLTNGMLLVPETTRRLIDAGVTSVMVSLDGASAATNDVIRDGARFETILANVRAALAIRQERGADLRLGISTVVGATNVHELPALARLVADLGADWLKVEETFAATPFARRDLLKPTASPVAERMAEVRDVLAGSRVVLVDHLAPPAGCTCDPQASEALRAFRAADDFANRAGFAPCRAAWEQACIDPDGTVHAVDYFQPALGNLLHASFLEIWNGAAAQRQRARALAGSSPAVREACVARLR